MHSNSAIQDLLVDPENYDFRPNRNNELNLEGESNFIGPYSPLIGYPDTTNYQGYYWIPGHRSNKASFPIPPNRAVIKKMRDVVMCQTGYR